MTIKQEYEEMKLNLRDWNSRTNYDDINYFYKIERYTKKAKSMFIKLLNEDHEKIAFDLRNDFISHEEFMKRLKVWNDCKRSIDYMAII